MHSQTKTGEIDLHINRYHISNTVKNDLLIKIKPSKELTPFIGFLIFGGMGAFFLYITWHQYVTEGPDTIWLPLLFGLFPAFMALLALQGGYFSRKKYLFRNDELICTNTFCFQTTIKKSDVASIYITQTMISERGKSAHDYSFCISLKIPSLKSGIFSLIHIEGRDSLSSTLGVLDNKGMSLAEKDARQMLFLIADHWNIQVGK